MSELIAPGKTLTTFAAGEVTVLAGSPKALFIKPAAGSSTPAPMGVEFEIAHKTSAGDYSLLRTVDASTIGQYGLLMAPGTYAVRRLASTVSAGMDVEG